MITKISKEEFNSLCLFEQKRIHLDNRSSSHLFWLNKNNELKSCVVLNLSGVDFVKKDTWNEINKIQLMEDFKYWLLQEWQEPCIIDQQKQNLV